MKLVKVKDFPRGADYEDILVKIDGKKEQLILRTVQLEVQLQNGQVKPHSDLAVNRFVAQIVHFFVAATGPGRSTLNLLFASTYEPLDKFLQQKALSQDLRLKLAVDFLRGVLYFDLTERYLKLAWEDLGVTDNRLVIFPTNSFALLEVDQQVSKLKLDRHCTNRASFLRNCACLFVCIVVGLTSIPLEHVASDFDNLLSKKIGGYYNIYIIREIISTLIKEGAGQEPANPSYPQKQLSTLVDNLVKSVPSNSDFEFAGSAD